MSDSRPLLLLAVESIFPLGQLTATPGALEALSNEEMQSALNRHASGDWGELDQHDRTENARALRDGLRLLSAYDSNNGTRFWIITEHDRSITTILLPKEY